MIRPADGCTLSELTAQGFSYSNLMEALGHDLKKLIEGLRKDGGRKGTEREAEENSGDSCLKERRTQKV